jgi:precorrin-2/cobalt-factor-2 C20-methyltransferase
LLTSKALRLLRAALVVAYPAPKHGDSFARSIVATWREAVQRESVIRMLMQPEPPPNAIHDAAVTRLATELDRGDPSSSIGP